MNFVQFRDYNGERRVGLSRDDGVSVIPGHATIYELLTAVIAGGRPVADVVAAASAGRIERLDALEADGRLLPPIDHPDPRRLWVTGTGFSHVREELQQGELERISSLDAAELTESLRLKRAAMGDVGGRSRGERPGILTEWFLKGDGTSLIAPGGALEAPAHCIGYSEESEIAGVYINDAAGAPVLIGHALGNEFADCETEKANAYYLAHSKLMPCAIGPELRIGRPPERLVGHTRVLRDGDPILEYDFFTGEANMVFDLATIEHHHFKHAPFRQPGDVHIHFYGTGARPGRYLGPPYRPGDTFEIGAPGFRHPLRVHLAEAPAAAMVQVRALA